MRRLIVTMTALGLVTLALVGCGAKSEGTAVPRQAVAVEAVTVSAGDLEQSIEVVGTLNPRFVAEVKSEVSGRVVEVRVTEWVRVTKGTVLATLDSREAGAGLEAARAALAQAQVNEDRAVRELERVTKLKKAGLATAQNLDDATSAREAAAAMITAAKAQVSGAETYLAKTTVLAPMDGVVAYRGVSPGDRVENMGGGPMFKIVDNHVLDLTVTVPSSRSAELSVGEKLAFTADALAGRVFEGTVKFINPSVDAASRTVSVTAEVANAKDELRGGQFVKGRIVTGSRSAVLRIPREALMTWDVAARTGEVMVLAGDSVTRRSVTLGVGMRDDIEVTTGLTAGERVVTRGGFNVRPGDPVKVVAPEGA
jgi:RND family efflux transporter MFP subunit